MHTTTTLCINQNDILNIYYIICNAIHNELDLSAVIRESITKIVSSSS